MAVWHVPMRCVGGAVDELITKKAISSVHAQWTLRAGQTAILRMKTDDSQVRGGLSEPPRASALPVQRHIGRWNSTPTVTPGSGNVIDGPLIGNGDAGAALTSLRVEQLDFYLGKGDYWADAVNYHWCAHPRVVLSADSPQLLPSSLWPLTDLPTVLPQGICLHAPCRRPLER